MFTEINEKIKDHEDAVNQARQLTEPKRRVVYDAAVQLQNELKYAGSPERERADLIAIIEDQIANTTESEKADASTVIQQLISGITHPEVRAGNGRILIDVFIDAARGYSEAQRRIALKSVLLAATGVVSPGLIAFQACWHTTIGLERLRQFASILNADAFREHCDTRARLTHDYATVSRYVEEFAPSVKPVEQDEERQRFKITNHNEGTPLVISKIRFKGYGSSTLVSPEELEEVKQSPLWKAGIQTGMIEVVAE